jgi:hypothetical protein
MLALNDGARENLDAAIAHDEDFALPHIALARWFQYAGDMAHAQASKLRALECLDGVTRREQQHVTAQATAVDGDGPGALALVYEHLQAFPRDAFVLKQVEGFAGSKLACVCMSVMIFVSKFDGLTYSSVIAVDAAAPATQRHPHWRCRLS